ncbi:MAG: hypothetical protein RLZZ142_1578, partial [Verrucomicrobiota bacterium]
MKCASHWIVGLGCALGWMGVALGVETLPEPVWAMVSEHCTGCHDGDTKKGGVNLDFTSIDLQVRGNAELLERMYRALEKGEMPPPKKARPEAAKREAVLAWLDETLTHKVPRHAVGLRRLTRGEYERTVAKALGVPFKVPFGFPADTTSHGFDNVAESLMLSPPLLDAYVESAIEVADLLFPAAPEPLPPSRRWVISPEDLSSTDGQTGLTNRVFDGKMRLVMRDYTSTASRFAAPASGQYRVKFRASAFRPEDEKPLLVKLHNLKEFEVPVSGSVEHEGTIVLHPGDSFGFTYANSSYRRLNCDAPYAEFAEDVLRRFQRHPRLLAAWLPLHEPKPDSASGALRLKIFDSVNAIQRSDAKNVAQMRLVIEAYAAALSKADLDLKEASPEAAKKVVDAMYDPWKVFNSLRVMHYYAVPWGDGFFTEGPGLDMESIEVEGPLAAVEHPRYGRARGLQRGLLGAEAAKLTTAEARRAGLEKMLSRLFRRESLPEESVRYGSLVEGHLEAGNRLEDAFHLALRTALVSPQFLYREGAAGRFTEADLASQLSYFLTSRPPDDALRAAVAGGSLGSSGGLRKEAERLLGSAEVQEFVTTFVGQWLGTRKISQIMPAASLGAFTDSHSKAMMQEPELVFSEILRENRPLSDFIAPDFTYTHQTVGGQMYGLKMEPLDHTKPFAMTRVALPRDGRAGGLLGMSGVMTATANGVDTQPVYRGKWVLETIFGDPPPPPPESVPALTPDTRSAKTIRELMAAHTAEESCAGCHRKLDPPGFLLENYDAIGQWRAKYPERSVNEGGKVVKQAGLPVDARATLPDGTVLQEVGELKRYVLGHI